MFGTVEYNNPRSLNSPFQFYKTIDFSLFIIIYQVYLLTDVSSARYPQPIITNLHYYFIFNYSFVSTRSVDSLSDNANEVSFERFLYIFKIFIYSLYLYDLYIYILSREFSFIEYFYNSSKRMNKCFILSSISPLDFRYFFITCSSDVHIHGTLSPYENAVSYLKFFVITPLLYSRDERV